MGRTGGQVISKGQLVGPAFTVAQQTVITEIGAFVKNCRSVISGVPQCPETLPLTVQIRRSINGVPDPSTVLASFTLTHDNEPLVYSYEFAKTSFVVEPGSYFALFAAQGDDVGALLSIASFPFGYQAGTVTLGFVNLLAGTSSASSRPLRAAVRIMGQPISGGDGTTTEQSAPLDVVRIAVFRGGARSRARQAGLPSQSLVVQDLMKAVCESYEIGLVTHHLPNVLVGRRVFVN